MKVANKVKYIVQKLFLESNNQELYAICNSEQAAKLLLDMPNFDLSITRVILDENGQIIETELIV